MINLPTDLGTYVYMVNPRMWGHSVPWKILAEEIYQDWGREWVACINLLCLAEYGRPYEQTFRPNAEEIERQVQSRNRSAILKFREAKTSEAIWCDELWQYFLDRFNEEGLANDQP